jgi:hypothetical protein
MRQASTVVVLAFLQRKRHKRNHDFTDGESLTLHGNKIAWHNPDGSVSMTLAGWPTSTTRDRLNTLCWHMISDKPFHQKKHEQYYNDRPITPDNVFTIHNIIAPAGWDVAYT